MKKIDIELTKDDIYTLFKHNVRAAIDTAYIYQAETGGHVEDLSITERMNKQISTLESTVAQLEKNLNAMKTFNNYYKSYTERGEK